MKSKNEYDIPYGQYYFNNVKCTRIELTNLIDKFIYTFFFPVVLHILRLYHTNHSSPVRRTGSELCEIRERQTDHDRSGKPLGGRTAGRSTRHEKRRGKLHVDDASPRGGRRRGHGGEGRWRQRQTHATVSYFTPATACLSTHVLRIIRPSEYRRGQVPSRHARILHRRPLWVRSTVGLPAIVRIQGAISAEERSGRDEIRDGVVTAVTVPDGRRR